MHNRVTEKDLKWLSHWVAVMTHLENTIARKDGSLQFSRERVSDVFKAQLIIDTMIAKLKKDKTKIDPEEPAQELPHISFAQAAVIQAGPPAMPQLDAESGEV